MLSFIFSLPVFSLTEKSFLSQIANPAHCPVLVLSENLPPEREHLFPDNQRSCLFTSKRSYTKSFKITKSTNVQIHGHIFLVQWRYDDRQKKIRFLKALTRSLMIFSCLDIQRRIKLIGLNKAIVVNINFLKILNSGFVVCCHHCLFQTNHSIFVEIKRKKVVHSWQVDQVVVEPTVGFSESWISRPPSPPPVWTKIFWCPLFWRYTAIKEGKPFWTLNTDYWVGFLNYLPAPTIKGVTVTIEHVASTSAAWSILPLKTAVSVCTTTTIW